MNVIRHTITKHPEKKLTALAYSVNSKQSEIQNNTFWNMWMWCDVWCRSDPSEPG